MHPFLLRFALAIMVCVPIAFIASTPFVAAASFGNWSIEDGMGAFPYAMLALTPPTVVASLSGGLLAGRYDLWNRSLSWSGAIWWGAMAGAVLMSMQFALNRMTMWIGPEFGMGDAAAVVLSAPFDVLYVAIFVGAPAGALNACVVRWRLHVASASHLAGTTGM